MDEGQPAPRRTMQWTTATLSGSALSQFSMLVQILNKRPCSRPDSPARRVQR